MPPACYPFLSTVTFFKGERMRPALLLLLAILLHVQPVSAARSFVDIWDDAVPLLHEGVDIIASGEDPSERSWAEVLTFRDPKFQRIVSECFAILADSQALDLIASRDAARDEIAAKRQKIAALQQELVSAPSSHWNPLKATRSSLQEDIAGLRKEIADLEHGLEADKERIFAEISARGLPVSREQLETMLSAADGKDTASIMAVAENISAIQRSIESQLAAPDASVELLQTYTGIYMMCNKVYVYALQQALQQIDSRYLDRLGKIRKEAAQLQEHARSLLSGAEETDRKILEVNIAANQRTLDAVDLYNQYLSRQKKHLQQLLQRAEKSFKVAVNTYRTVKTSSDLLGMMHTSEADFSRIFAFQPPDLSLLYDARLRQEFDDITSRLRAAE